MTKSSTVRVTTDFQENETLLNLKEQFLRNLNLQIQQSLNETSKMIIDHEQGCRSKPQGYDGEPRALLIMVLSKVNNDRERQTIRNTWGGRAKQLGVILFFLLGSTEDELLQEKVLKENQEQNDILQGTARDDYYNLTLKSLTMMNWVATRCTPNLHGNETSPIRYVLKIDEDVLLNVDLLLASSAGLENRTNTMIGHLQSNSKPWRNHSSLYYIPLTMYNHTYWPPFLSGPAYWFTVDVADKIYRAAMEDREAVNSVYHLEDVYLTGIVARKVGVIRINDRRFHNLIAENVHLRWNETLTSHEWKHELNRIQDLWLMIHLWKHKNRTISKEGLKLIVKAYLNSLIDT